MKLGSLVSWSKEEDTYTLINEGITLTAEQAMAIATAYYSVKGPINPNYGAGHAELTEWTGNIHEDTTNMQ